MLDRDEPNQETIEALREAERIAKDSNVHGYDDVHRLFADILS